MRWKGWKKWKKPKPRARRRHDMALNLKTMQYVDGLQLRIATGNLQTFYYCIWFFGTAIACRVIGVSSYLFSWDLSILCSLFWANKHAVYLIIFIPGVFHVEQSPIAKLLGIAQLCLRSYFVRLPVAQYNCLVSQYNCLVSQYNADGSIYIRFLPPYVFHFL